MLKIYYIYNGKEHTFQKKIIITCYFSIKCLFFFFLSISTLILWVHNFFALFFKYFMGLISYYKMKKKKWPYKICTTFLLYIYYFFKTKIIYLYYQTSYLKTVIFIIDSFSYFQKKLSPIYILTLYIYYIFKKKKKDK